MSIGGYSSTPILGPIKAERYLSSSTDIVSVLYFFMLTKKLMHL
jgi:hypothetical protein